MKCYNLVYYAMLCYTILDDTIQCYIIFYYAMVRSAMPCQWCHATLHWTTWSSPTLPYCYTRYTLCWNMLYCIVIYRSSGVRVASPALPKSLLVISSCHTQLTNRILYIAVLYGILLQGGDGPQSLSRRWIWHPISLDDTTILWYILFYYTALFFFSRRWRGIPHLLQGGGVGPPHPTDHIKLQHTILYYTIPCYPLLCYAMYAMLYYTIQYYTILHCTLLCYGALSYAMLLFIQ